MLTLLALVALTALSTALVVKFPPSHEIWQEPKE